VGEKETSAAGAPRRIVDCGMRITDSKKNQDAIASGAKQSPVETWKIKKRILGRFIADADWRESGI
jgi:hypothetical protein